MRRKIKRREKSRKTSATRVALAWFNVYFWLLCFSFITITIVIKTSFFLYQNRPFFSTQNWFFQAQYCSFKSCTHVSLCWHISVEVDIFGKGLTERKPASNQWQFQSKTSSETQGQLVGSGRSKPDKIEVALQFLLGQYSVFSHLLFVPPQQTALWAAPPPGPVRSPRDLGSNFFTIKPRWHCETGGSQDKFLLLPETELKNDCACSFARAEKLGKTT